MKKSRNIHVVPGADRTWAVEREGSSRALSRHRTQAAARRKARAVARRTKVELFVHSRTGRIESRDSFGHDPYPPRG